MLTCVAKTVDVTSVFLADGEQFSRLFRTGVAARTPTDRSNVRSRRSRLLRRNLDVSDGLVKGRAGSSRAWRWRPTRTRFSTSLLTARSAWPQTFRCEEHKRSASNVHPVHTARNIRAPHRMYTRSTRSRTAKVGHLHVVRLVMDLHLQGRVVVVRAAPISTLRTWRTSSVSGATTTTTSMSTSRMDS